MPPLVIPPWANDALAAALAVTLASIALLLLALVSARRTRLRAESDRARFVARWEPLLYAHMDDPQVPLPRLEKIETLLFLQLWLRIAGYVRGEAQTALVATASSLGMKAAVLDLLDSSDLWTRHLAVRAAGILGIAEAVSALQNEIRRCDHRTALVAISALFRIDTQAATVALHGQLVELVWPPAALARLLAPAGELAMPLLANEIAQSPPRRAPRLIRVLDAISNSDALPILRERLNTTRNQEEIAILLRALGRVGTDPDREIARGFLNDTDPLIRMQAAACLGHLGAQEDAGVLVALLRDRVWWVRYRAAGAIAALLRRDQARLRAVIDAQTDLAGREILARAAVEAALTA